jgi:predicted nucleotidyltransferase
MMELERLLRALCDAEVHFVIIGGVAATVHGSARLTSDLDVVYDRDPANLQRLAGALKPLEPYLRGAPPGLPFRFDVETLRKGLNFTLITTAGAIDLLGEVAGLGGYREANEHSFEVKLFGATTRVLDLEALIRAKRAAGRPRDLEVIAELEAIRDETGG